MRSRRSLLLYLASAADDIIAAILLFPIYLVAGESLRLEKKPGGAITVAPHVIVYRAGRASRGGWSRTQEHEHTHSEQMEAASTSGVFLGAVCFAHGGGEGLAVAIWALTRISVTLAANVVAWLRGEPLYRGSHAEAAAYAIDDALDLNPKP